MSLFDSYDENRTAVLNPWNVYQPVEGFPETIIITFGSAILNLALELYEGQPVAIPETGGSLRVYRFAVQAPGRENGASDHGEAMKSIGICRVPMGAPMTVAYMEECIAMGAKNFVVFGSCGTLDRNIPAGHLIVPTAAYRDEGTSYHYMSVSAGDYIEVETADRTAEIIESMGLPTLKTLIWTTDGLYRETRRNMEARRREGCQVVDMECSAVMTLARYRGIRACQFVYAEDNLDDIQWDPRTMGKVPKSAKELYLRVAVEIARNL